MNIAIGKIIYGNRASGLPETSDDVRKGIASHGVSIFEIEKKLGKWKIKKDSLYNRKITGDTKNSFRWTSSWVLFNEN